MDPAIQHDLIYDVGVSEGNDSDFYLRKGFRVVGVEADPLLRTELEERFAEPMAAGRYALVSAAAAREAGGEIRFFHHGHEQGRSSLVHEASGAVELSVPTTDWAALVGQFGVPRYAKIDIEGSEPPFLEGMVEHGRLPEYMSCEVQNTEPIRLMRDMGYTRFRLINQVLVPGFRPPQPPLEGTAWAEPPTWHWSGLFGRELPGKRWYSFEEVRGQYDAIHELWLHGTLVAGWLDCHAWWGDD